MRDESPSYPDPHDVAIYQMKTLISNWLETFIFIVAVLCLIVTLRLMFSQK